MPPDLTTAAGVIAALCAVIAVLWRDHLRADTDDRTERDDWKALAREAANDNRRLAAAVEAALNIKVPPVP